MASLLLMLGFFVLSIPVSGIVIAGCARIAGSTSGVLRKGLIASAQIVAIQLTISAACLWVLPAQGPSVATGRSNPFPQATMNQTASPWGEREPFLSNRVVLIGDLAASIATQLAAPFIVCLGTFGLSGKRRFVPALGWFVGVAVNLAIGLLVLRPFFVEAFVIPSESMAPTLLVDDRIAVCKVLTPRRWDIVAYKQVTPENESATWVKRIVGLPGERVVFADGGLRVNGRAVVPPPSLATLFSGKLHAVYQSVHVRGARYRDGEEIVLGSDEFFVVGDFLEYSADSRMTGPVNRAAIIGVADARYFPMNRLGWIRP